MIRDFGINFKLVKSHLEEKNTEDFDFVKEFKTEVFKLLQTRDLQRTMTTSGTLLLAKSDGAKLVYPLITSVLDSVNSSDIKQFISFLTSIFHHYDKHNSQKGTSG